jgi:hypothetical protein
LGTYGSTGSATLGRAQATGTIRNAPPPQPCAPRPPVQIWPSAAGVSLSVVVAVSPLNTGESNAIREFRFGGFQNARVSRNGQVIASGQAIALPANSTTFDFVVERVQPGSAATVQLTAVDSCGEWPTFVGGGPAAGF